MNEDTKSIRQQLRELLAQGLTPEEATEKVLAQYRPHRLVGYAYPTVLRDAQGLARTRDRTIENRAWGVGPADDGQQREGLAPREGGLAPRDVMRRRQARMRLPEVKFRLGDGSEVAWGQATVAQHELRIAWQRTHIRSVGLDIDRHQQAVDLIHARGVERLDDIPGWADLIPVPGDDASGAAA